MGYIYTTTLNNLTVIVHKTNDIIRLIKDRSGLNEAWTGLASASVVNAVKNQNAKIYTFAKDKIEADKAIEYPPLKVYKVGNGEIILSSADLILANYIDISFILPEAGNCVEIIKLYANGLRELTRAIEVVL